MKLYMHPVSNASRPVRLYMAEKGIDCEEVVVDLMKGEHYQEPYVSMNPSKQVPYLVDGDLLLTESAAILRYLAGKYGHPEYPADLKERAKVDELMDWFNTQFYRDYGYGLAYPQMFPHHKRPSDEFHDGVISWGRDKAQGWFKVLDEHWLGKDKKYLRGDQITIADYFGASLVTLGEVIRCNFASYPNVDRWIGTMKQLPSWNKVNEAMYGFQSYLKDQVFKAL
jgi:glutathione S-transferase